MSPTPRRLGLAAALILVTAADAPADNPTKAEIGQRGKAATAFVEVARRGSGTAFCVHASGLFVTNEHVVRGADKADITLVLDAGLATQRALTATRAYASKATQIIAGVLIWSSLSR